MAKYRCEPLAELARQLHFAPAVRRAQQIERAEQLYWKIDPQQAYPLTYITYQITGYRSDDDRASRTTLVGAAVSDDLLTLVTDLSQTLERGFEDYTPRPLSQAELARRLNVAQRSIARYRKQGLFARRLTVETSRGRRFKLGFLPESIDRFLAHRGEMIEQASRFARIDEPTRHQMILRARRIAGRSDASPYRVAQHLAAKYDRSVEAVRQILIHHDQHDPRFAIFPDHSPRLTDRQKHVLLRAWRRGVRVNQMARRYGKTRDAIYSAVGQAQADALARIKLDPITSPTFNRPDAEMVILQRPATIDPDDVPNDTDPLDRATLDLLPHPIAEICHRPLPSAADEQSQFVRYNFCKYRAAQLRDALDRYHPSHEQIDWIHTYIRHAAMLQRHLVCQYLREVARVARYHTPAGADPDVFERRLAIGTHTLFEQIETYDAGRGGRFIAALRWGLMRQYARQRKTVRTRSLRLIGAWLAAQRRLDGWLDAVDEFPRDLIACRFDLPLRPASMPRTLAQVSEQMHRPYIMVSRHDRLAMFALRRAAGWENMRLHHALPLRLRVVAASRRPK